VIAEEEDAQNMGEKKIIKSKNVETELSPVRTKRKSQDFHNKSSKKQKTSVRKNSPPPNSDSDIETILDKRISRQGQNEYLVQRKSSPTHRWFKEADLNCPKQLKEFQYLESSEFPVPQASNANQQSQTTSSSPSTSNSSPNQTYTDTSPTEQFSQPKTEQLSYNRYSETTPRRSSRVKNLSSSNSKVSSDSLGLPSIKKKKNSNPLSRS